MNARNSHSHTERVLATLGDLPAADALQVLNTAMGKVLAGIERAPDIAAPQAVSPLLASLMQRSQGGHSRIDGDPELLAFILGLPAHLTYPQIEAACRARFGAERAPSKSAIHRFVQRLKHPNGKKE